MKKRTRKSGFMLLEVVVASSVVGLVLVLMLGAIQHSVRLSEQSLQITRAAFLLEEGAEGFKTIRDRDWVNISGLSTTDTYYLLWNGADWSTTTTVTQDGSFTRSLVVSDVYRDATTDDIVTTGGVLDAGTRKIVVTVSWTGQSGVLLSESLPFYVADVVQ